MLKHQWVTTAACRKYGEPRGFRLHAVVASPADTFLGILGLAAACGLRPRRGWGLDLFIDKRCAACLRRLGLACPRCRGRGDLGRASGYDPCAACFGTGERGVTAAELQKRGLVY